MVAGARAGAAANAHLADATATASTLNYALGTRHMKSWMHGAAHGAPAASPPVASNPTPAASNPAPAYAPNPHRKRGRPRKYPLPDAHHHQHATDARPPSALSHERLPASNSTSPQLPNVVTNRARPASPSHAHIVEFPSPTPSADDVYSADAHEPETSHTATFRRSSFAPLQSPSAFGQPASLGQHASVWKRPAGDDPAAGEKRARIDTAPRRQPSVATRTPSTASSSDPTPQWIRDTTAVLQGQDFSHNPSRDQTSSAQTASPQLTHASPLVPTQPFGVLPNAQQLAHQPAHPHRAVVSPRQAPEDVTCYSVELCNRMIEVFKIGISAHSDGDQLRLHTIEDAVKMQDWAYLTLHQYYCLMTCSVPSLPVDLQRHPNFNATYSLMHNLLQDTWPLTKPFLRFFCTFPFSLDSLASTWPATYQQSVRIMATFLDHSPRILQLKDASERRRVPPMPREIADCSVTSPMIERLLVQSIIRALGTFYPQGPAQIVFLEQTLRAFYLAQTDFRQRRSHGQLGGRQQADEEWQAWVSNFAQITRSIELSIRQSLQSNNPLSPEMHQQPQPQANNRPSETTVRHRPQPPPPATYGRAASQVQPSSRRQRHTALLPRRGVLLQQQRVPNPARYGLHQAHLRSPVLQASDHSTPLHYFWQGFFKKPTKVVNANNAIETISFTLSQEDMRLIAPVIPAAPGAPDSRAIDEHHKTARLRCVKWRSDEEPTESAWAVAETSWIPHAYFIFNETPLQLRKKIHHGKDLPVDLTGLLREGPNTLEISVMSPAHDKAHHNYLLAVELLGARSSTSIKADCLANTIPAPSVLAAIKRKLAPRPASDSDADDLVIVATSLTIALRDPFTASHIPLTPVRAASCAHNEAFDLDTFLATRARAGDVSRADAWRCPICRGDARPCVLAVDGLLAHVRGVLEKRGELGVRAIEIDASGGWRVKKEVREGVRDESEDEDDGVQSVARSAARRASASASAAATAPAVEVIDLDSD
ncbi:hypothetical protein C7974DRAFT_302300 [Boeremia exigua]|uniref:uncharacterized protein n=1 Tax=Boeremia exigua TaxID=749465 RepID=UPI001E8E46BD|nr:uncharacterized protein C7974DRAFT_302300 [Boeremia exigua]KAH6642923.1 hypothetical protein C7974DRAFT_302300 [Boeremia exigua]